LGHRSSPQEGRKDKFLFTPVPYGHSDETLDDIEKSFVNVPVWTLQGAMVEALLHANMTSPDT
jgi:hypothetical protein